MKIKSPKDSGHPEYDLLMPVLIARDYDNKSYNSTAITVAVGKSCKKYGRIRQRK